MVKKSVDAPSARRRLAALASCAIALAIMAPTQIARADIAQDKVVTPASSTAATDLGRHALQVPLPAESTEPTPTGMPTPSYDIRLAAVDPAPPPPPPPPPDPKGGGGGGGGGGDGKGGGGGGGGGDGKGGGGAPSPSPSTTPPPVYTWVKVGEATRYESGAAYWPDTPQQYAGYPGTVQRSTPPIGLPACPSGGNSCHNYTSSNYCRFDYIGGWGDPWERNYARTVSWSGWYGVDIMEQYKDGKPTGARQEWRNNKANYTMQGCGYGNGPLPRDAECAITVGPVRFSGPGPEAQAGNPYGVPAGTRYGDYGTNDSNAPAYAGRKATDEHARPGEPTVTPDTQGVWVDTRTATRSSAAWGRPPVPGYENASNLPGYNGRAAPGWFNPRTVPRQPWNVRTSSPAQTWIWTGTFGRAFNSQGRNLYGIGNNSRSLDAYDACIDQQATFPGRESLYGYGNYEVTINRELTTCRIWDYGPTYGVRVFRGCDPRQTADIRPWVISECQGKMSQRTEMEGPDSERRFDPSNCVTGTISDSTNGGEARCQWNSPTGDSTPTIYAPGNRGVNIPENVNAASDGRHWRVTYPNPSSMTIWPIDGPDYTALNGRNPRRTGVALNAALRPDGSGASNTKWLIWNVSHESSPWNLSRNPRDLRADGTRKQSESNPNHNRQPFGTFIGNQYNKLARIGAGTSTRRDIDGDGTLEGYRTPGSISQAKDAGESQDTWSPGRRTMEIWFKQPGTFPASAFPYFIAERCSNSSRIGACSQGKNFATVVRYFQMFEVTLIEGAVTGLRSVSGSGGMDRLVFSREDIPANRYQHIVVGNCKTPWNSFRVLSSRTIPGTR